MRRALPGGLAVVVLAGLWWVTRPAPIEISERPAPANRTAVHGPSAPVAAPPAADPAEVQWSSQLEAVATDCGLATHSRCEGDHCVAVTEVPRLDSPVGWLRMAARSPSLVASVVAGDLGLPDRALPCRGAIRDLAHTTTLAISYGDGELWCLLDSPDTSPALCDRAVADAISTAAPRFEAGADRIVELRPPA